MLVFTVLWHANESFAHLASQVHTFGKIPYWQAAARVDQYSIGKRGDAIQSSLVHLLLLQRSR